MGGSTLSLLHDRTFNYTGDSQAQELCLYLTKAASVPYFEILEKWIYRGIIKDPYRYDLSNSLYSCTFSSVLAEKTFDDINEHLMICVHKSRATQYDVSFS